MSEFYTYITKQNDRWDIISYQFYNSPFLYEKIIKENPTIKIEPILEPGIKLKIPVLEKSETISKELPPWKE